MLRAPLALPILMYHKVGCPVVSRADTFLNVSTSDFRRQVQALVSLGYTARPFADIVAALTTGQSLPRRTFALTFDDGYVCVGECAAPVLAAFGFSGTVFVVSSAVGRTNAWDRVTGRPELPLMDWCALQQLRVAGWEIAGHTRSHPHLNALSDREAAAEILLGKGETEARLDVSLHTFCYPFGHLSERTPALVRAAGFQGACTTRSGLARANSDPFRLPRVKVAYRDGVFGLLYRMLVRSRLPQKRR